jgi:hypothetical protein
VQHPIARSISTCRSGRPSGRTFRRPAAGTASSLDRAGSPRAAGSRVEPGAERAHQRPPARQPTRVPQRHHTRSSHDPTSLSGRSGGARPDQARWADDSGFRRSNPSGNASRGQGPWRRSETTPHAQIFAATAGSKMVSSRLGSTGTRQSLASQRGRERSRQPPHIVRGAATTRRCQWRRWRAGWVVVRRGGSSPGRRQRAARMSSSETTDCSVSDW